MSARIAAITMPKWGMTMTEGKVARWLVGEGEVVQAGQEVIEIETSKITNVMETPAGGTLRRRLIEEGATAPVGALIGVVADKAVGEAEVATFIAEHAADADNAEGQAAAKSAARLVDAGGIRLNVLSQGAGAATPVLLLHGFGGDLNSWMFNQAALAAERPVHALDLPSHGGSPLIDMAKGVPMLTRAVVAGLDALGIAKAHVVGHSLGGAIALFLARIVPGRVASLTLIAPGGIGPEIDKAFLEGFARADRRKDMQEVMGKLFADPSRVTREMVDASLEYKRLDGVPEALAALMGSMLEADGRQRGGLRETLASLAMPVQVIWGTQDAIIPVSQAEGLPANVVVHRIEGAGHMPQMEAAGEVNRLILEQARKSEG